MKRIQSLPLSLRPREKILKYGADALTIEELVAALWITGTKTTSIAKLSTTTAKFLTKQNISLPLLQKQKISPSKIAQLLAALELGKRYASKKTITISTADHIFAQSQEILHADKESLLCFYLNARGEILKKELVAMGTMNKVNLLPREIFSVIKELPVSGIILVHNHPSGNLEASKDDIVFTKRVKIAGDIIGVKLLDHLIICSEGWKRILF